MKKTFRTTRTDTDKHRRGRAVRGRPCLSVFVRVNPLFIRVCLCFLSAITLGLSAAEKTEEADNATFAARRAKLAKRPKKIFAHYMGCFPVGAKAISPAYARSKYKNARHDSPNFEYAFGGRRRGEPLLPDSVNGLTLEESADLEVRRAMRAGIDGFAFMAIAGGGNNVFPVMDAMFKVCEKNDYPFEITWALSGLDKSIEAIEYTLKKHGNSPKLARRDGKVLMLGYQSVFSGIEGAREIFAKRHPDIKADSPEERYSPEFLRLLREGYREKLEKRFNTPMYFQFGFGALFCGAKGKPSVERPWPEIIGYLAEGFGAINAFHYASGPDDYDAVAKAVTDKGSEWGEPLMYSYENLLWRSFRPRSFPLDPGSNAIRHCWENARRNNATLIQFTTWNDYHESTTLAPTTNIRYGLLDLNAYFVKWWKTGTPPKTDHDRIYLIYPKYRHELTTYPFGNRGVWTDTEKMNKLEVLTILTAPATVRLAGRSIEWKAPAGLSYKQLPLQPGTTNVEVVRNGKLAAKLDNSVDPVTDRPYREGHGMACVSTEDLRHWKADFGNADPAPMLRGEYGDPDNDGLPNWFEMYWFGKHFRDWESATKTDPNADPDGDGISNLEEYRARTNPTVATRYEPGFVWDLADVTGTVTRQPDLPSGPEKRDESAVELGLEEPKKVSSSAFNPENDTFDTPVWYFKHKYADTYPVEHGGYWMCERFGWYPSACKALYAPPYNTPSPSKPAGGFVRLWEKTDNRPSGESMPLAASRYQISVGPYGLQALGWESPVEGTVRVEAKLSPLAGDEKRYAPATISVERESSAKPLFSKQFRPDQGVEIATAPIDVKKGKMLYMVLDGAPGKNRGFTLNLDKLKIRLVTKTE